MSLHRDSLYPSLLAPFSLAGRRLRNRLMHASMTTLMVMGRAHDIRYCVSCNTCWDTIVTQHRPIACDNNPRVAATAEGHAAGNAI